MSQILDDHTQVSLDQADSEVIDLREYWYIIRKNMLGIFTFTFVISAIAILVLFLLADVYEGDCTLLIEADQPNVVSVNPVYDFGMGKAEYYATQFTIMSSKNLTRRVIDENKKDFEAYFDVEYPKSIQGMMEHIIPSKEDKEDKMIDFFTKNVTITPTKDTQLVVISYLSKNDALAVKLANDLAQAYIDAGLDEKLEMTKRASGWLTEKIEGLKHKVDDSGLRLQQYRDRENLVDVQGTITMVGRELEDTAQKLADASQARAQDEYMVSQIDKLPDRSVDKASTIPVVLKDPLFQQLKQVEGDAEKNLAELSNRYGQQHPKYTAAKQAYESAKKNTEAQVLKLIEGARKQYQVDKSAEEELTKRMATLKVKAQEINQKQYQLDQLSHELDMNQQLYQTFFSRIKETSASLDLTTPNARIVDPAVLSSEPAKPKRGLLSVLAIIVSMILGVALALFKESINSTVRSRDDVLLKLHSQLLGVLPLLKEKDASSNACMEFINHTMGTFSESVRTIRTGVVLSGLDNPHKILVVTSSIPSEGKTTVSANLAAAFGQMGKTLLIDADMRRPAIAKNFGIKLSSPGLSDLVAETAEPKECIHHIDSLGIDVIPAGMVPPNPLELLSSRRFAAVLAGLEKHYDRIIIDSAPCEVVSDALILSTFASAVIYVVKADSTNIKVVKSGVGRLRQAKAPLTGVVLNQVNIEKNSKYGYGYYGQYYGGYYDYYGYSSPASKKEETAADS